MSIRRGLGGWTFLTNLRLRKRRPFYGQIILAPPQNLWVKNTMFRGGREVQESSQLVEFGFCEAAPMSNREAKQRPLSRTLGKGLTRHWRIGDRDIPWQVASQQSLPPFLPAPESDPKSSPNSTIGQRSHSSETPQCFQDASRQITH